MIFYILVLVDVIFLLTHTLDKSRNFNIILSICTALFMNSADPFIGLPLEFVFMFLALIFGLIYNCRNGICIEKKYYFLILLLIIVLLVPIAEISLGINQQKMLILKESSSDTLDLESEMLYASVDFYVIKHFIFLIAFLIFLMINKNVFHDKNFICILIKSIKVVGVIFFIGVFVEWLFVNITGIYDRNIMIFIFNIKYSRQLVLWQTWGSYAVPFSLSERSKIATGVLAFLIILFREKINKKTILELLLVLLAVYCSGSSSALFISVIFSSLILMKVVYFSNNSILKISAILVLCIGAILLIIYNETFFEKIVNYVDENETSGSAFYRAQANDAATKVLQYHFLFGTGIGTLYCHSLILQTVGNIGILGFGLVLYFTFSIVGYKPSKIDLLYWIILAVFFYNYSTVQDFTSVKLLNVVLLMSPSSYMQTTQLKMVIFKKNMVRKM
ncbi:MAG: hypothetical protein IKP77_02415 [Acholeplasmatales bacterium]|nr:hypothetical protein [Acholeplasmatales bacterium]